MSAVLLSSTHARELWRQMLRIRRFEERCAELYQQQKIRGFLHLYVGEEAVAAGAMRALEPGDAVLATYREHGHALARGLPMGEVMAEMYGKVEGSSHGRGGSMHVFDVSRRFFGGNAIVAGHLPMAVGFGLAALWRDEPRVAACFFGEGAVAEGEFHEALNLAALWRLPVLFCCENNRYAMGSALERTEAQADLVAKAQACGVAGQAVDGMDVLAVEAAVREAAAQARGGGGPRFLELQTYRFRAHSMFDAQLYREKAEVERWQTRDPLVTFAAEAEREGLLDAAARAAIEAEVLAEVDAAVAFAEAGHWEPEAELSRNVVAEAVPPAPELPRNAEARTLSCREAMKEAIAEAIRADDRVLLMGEDVGRYGGCYAVSKGLLAELGERAVRDTPLSESGFVGAGVGAAIDGLRPIVEVMTVNFAFLAMDQLVNNAATLRHMSGGQVAVPLVVRMATGAGRQLAAQHSHSLENLYAHVPGLRVVAPATVEDFRYMLWTALHDPDPVLIFEHVGLYNAEGTLAAGAGPVDLDHAAVRRAGRDVSLLTYGGSLPKTMEAAGRLAALGIDAEVVDLRVLRPLDEAALVASVAKTRRAVVIDEGWRSGGLAGEIAARLQERCFWELDAPILRVNTVEVPIPYPKHLEDAALPKVDDIVAAARQVVGEVRGG